MSPDFALPSSMLRRRRPVPVVMRVAFIAWRLQTFCLIGVFVRERGKCVGLLRDSEIHWTTDGPARARGVTRNARLRTVRHLKDGHDISCRTLGIPAPTIRQILEACGNDRAIALLQDAIEECVAEIAAAPLWAAHHAIEVLQFHIGRRITPKRPPDHRNDHEGRWIGIA